MAIDVGTFLWENEPDTLTPKEQRVLSFIKEKGKHGKRPKKLTLESSGPKKSAWITSMLGKDKPKNI